MYVRVHGTLILFAVLDSRLLNTWILEYIGHSSTVCIVYVFVYGQNEMYEDENANEISTKFNQITERSY